MDYQYLDAVTDFASLPTTGNQIRDVRFVIADQLSYVWDGTSWQPSPIVG